MASEPKAHHFIPVGHLAKFGTASRKPRDARLWVYDKQAGATRRGKAGKLATENDLYTYRVPRFPGNVQTLQGLAEAIAGIENRDRWARRTRQKSSSEASAALPKWNSSIRECTVSPRTSALTFSLTLRSCWHSIQ